MEMIKAAEIPTERLPIKNTVRNKIEMMARNDTGDREKPNAVSKDWRNFLSNFLSSRISRCLVLSRRSILPLEIAERIRPPNIR